MNTPSTEDCAATVNGDQCWEEPWVTQPVPLCRRHLAAVMHIATEKFIQPETAGTAGEAADADVIGRARVLDRDGAFDGPHPSAVYFLTNGNRVKIGYTTNIKSRVGAFALREQDVLLLLRGGVDLEQALHRRFARERVSKTEWFEMTHRIAGFIERCRHRAPMRLRESSPSPWVPGQKVPPRAKAATAKDRLLRVLRDCQGPDAYLHVDQIVQMTGAAPGTIANACTALLKDGKLVRGPDKGTYGIPLTPITD